MKTTMNILPIKDIDFESKSIFKKLVKASSALAELNGIVKTIPNQQILINSLILQEAKDSSEIENIITTHDEIYKSDMNMEISKESKEIQRYRDAMMKGFSSVKDNGLLLVKDIVQIQKIIENNDAGIRKQSGTNLKNKSNGEVIYTPPQEYNEIMDLMHNLENYINKDDDIDALIKMAIIHHQLESIHPFYDGNGRTGRIINILYLVLNNKLDLPILYLSGYIIKNKSQYYKLLQEVRTKKAWEEWIIYILDGIEQVSKKQTTLINNIRNLMQDTKNIIRDKLPKIYSKDLIDILFTHPYTKINILEKRLDISRQTASNHLSKLEEINILTMQKLGRDKYFINHKLFDILSKNILDID